MGKEYRKGEGNSFQQDSKCLSEAREERNGERIKRGDAR